jgi:recombination protein RecA
MGKVVQMSEHTGKINTSELAKKINKKLGIEAAHDLKVDDPVSIRDWIPTGSRWLDCTIAPGKVAGIPVGRITELAGLSSAGKSFMALQIAANAQKKGMYVVYFDAESALSNEFMVKAGVDINNILYQSAISVEKTLETIEYVMENWSQARVLFIWDSIAATPSEKDVEGDFNPQSSMAVKPRIFAKAFSKLTIPLASTQSTLLLVNQLKTNITSRPAEALVEPYIAPGGKALEYFSSLRIWLTKRKSKASFELDEDGVRVGSHVKAFIKKSRMGSEGRSCEFKIMWGGKNVRIQDEESWLEVLKSAKHPNFSLSGAWYTMIGKDGKEVKFQSKQWLDKLKEKNFKETVISLMDEILIDKYKS